MDGIANVAKQQQTQLAHQDIQTTQHATQTQKVAHQDIVKQMQDSTIASKQDINKSEEMVQKLVEDLNKALSPFNTSIKFGVDSQDVFYVSVIEEKTHKMIRRFPAEKAQSLLPKMKELTGILFDSKG